MMENIKPMDIEKRSFAIITELLGDTKLEEENELVIKRVIHTTADFDYADSLAFSPDVIEKAKAALAAGATVVTDTNMALSGVSKATLAKLGGKAVCLMADEQVASEAKARGVTRAVVSMEHAAKFEGPLLFAIGNAPTALIRLHELIEEGIVAPALVIGVPVGFVNVVEAKELFIGGDTPYIIARPQGRLECSRVHCQCAALSDGTSRRLLTRKKRKFQLKLPLLFISISLFPCSRQCMRRYCPL